MVDTIVQLLIVVLGAIDIWLFAKEKMKAAFILVILSQPLWLYSTIQNKQWGMLALTLWYLYCGISGLRRLHLERTQLCNRQQDCNSKRSD